MMREFKSQTTEPQYVLKDSKSKILETTRLIILTELPSAFQLRGPVQQTSPPVFLRLSDPV